MPLIILILLLLLGGGNYYLAHRTCRWMKFFIPRSSIKMPFAFFILMSVIMLLSIIRPFDNVLQQILSVIGSYWMGIFVYLLVFYLLADIITFIPSVFKLLTTNKLSQARVVAGLTATVLALSFSVYGFLHAKSLTLTEYNISLCENSKTEINLVFISDVHLGAIGSEDKLEKIVAEINRQSPDLVCIAGDFFDSDFETIKNPEKAIDIVKKINSRYGVYACLGNHDAGKTLSLMQDFYKKANIKLLTDEYVIIDNKFVLAGRLDISPIGSTNSMERGDISNLLKDLNNNLPIIVMDHNPKEISTYPKSVNLVLSGHTHKGQVFPANLITSLIYDVDYGYYKTKAGTQAVVSSGAGYWGLPMRVGTNCEIVKINLLV